MIGGGDQAIAQKPRDLHGAGGRGDPRPNRRWPTCEPPRVATQDHVGHVDEMSINAESVQHLDPLKYLLDLPRRVLGWCRPEPALQGGAAVVRLRDRGAPLGEHQRIEGVMNAAGERRLVASMICGPVVINVPDAALVHDLVKRATGIPIDESQWALELIREGSKP